MVYSRVARRLPCEKSERSMYKKKIKQEKKKTRANEAILTKRYEKEEEKLKASISRIIQCLFEFLNFQSEFRVFISNNTIAFLSFLPFFARTL